MRTVVTGGAGFIGSHVVDRLVALGHRVLVIDDLSNGSLDRVPSEAEFERLDVVDERTVRLIAGWRADRVIHCAAQTSVAISVREPVRDAHSNILGTAMVVQAAEAAGASHFVYVTTGGALYGDPQYLPCDEDHPIRPISPYGMSKWAGENYLGLLGGARLRRVALRLANVYGPRQVPGGEAGVVSIFADRMWRGETVEIHGDGEQTRDFLYVGDAVDAIAAAIASDAAMTVNIGSGTGTSINALFRALARIADYEREPKFAAARPGDVRHSVLSPLRARQALGWSPTTSLDEGLLQTFRWVTAR
jgi:UDP-glucose 4-epimerase